MDVAVHNRLKVGVVAKKWAWPIKFRVDFLLCPSLSSYKLANYILSGKDRSGFRNMCHIALACGTERRKDLETWRTYNILSC